MNKFNFLENYDSLKKWEKVSLNLIVENDAKGKDFNLSIIKISKIKSLIKNNKTFILPPLSILGLTFLIFSFSILPRFNIWRLTNKSITFDDKYFELENTNNHEHKP